MTCRGDAAATDWLFFGGGRASVRFRPPFLCPGQSRDGGPGQNSKRGAGRVSGQDGGARSGLWAPRAEQQKKRGPCRCSRQGRRTCAGRAALRGGGAPGRTAKETRSVAAFQTKRERLRSVRRFGVVVLRAELQKGRGPWRHFRPSGRGCGPCGASVSEGGGSEVGKVRKGVAGGSRSGGGEVRVGVTGSRSVGGEVRVGVAAAAWQARHE